VTVSGSELPTADQRAVSCQPAGRHPASQPGQPTGVAFGYARYHVIPGWESARNRALIDAESRSL
jgi:hypothetical protein